ncbi:uncharacterized protein FRV6_11221 [Fusarium oxysporum]|uniref:Uncharacterized protein n=1 Tax=Fusarium oxysporum TaxID=5507 RepID=A0A2H3TEF9_FUSOX|nr:uncharacterized protein FRV6_11221 [Fusarium oxysporum]
MTARFGSQLDNRNKSGKPEHIPFQN